MDHILILKSKLTIPELPKGFLLANRLKKLHKRMDSQRAITICAAAGYGKTTLAVSYFSFQVEKGSRICWYRLDSGDYQPSVFVSHLIETIFPSEASEFAGARKTLAEYAEIHLQPQHAIAMICQEMWILYKAENPPTYIVLDDFQNVANAPGFVEMIRFLLDNLPPTCTIIILTRNDLNIFTEKQKLENNILKIGMHDLALSKTEIADLISQMTETIPDYKLARFVEKSTEGWIAGIIIFCQAINSKGQDITTIDATKLGYEDSLFRYMSMEIFKSVGSDLQETLTMLALLQDFSEIEALEILGIHNIHPLMEQCLDFGLFIQRIPGKPVTYHFHSLFREFLLYVLKERYSRDQITGLHLKAAYYYIEHMSHTRAAEHLAKCENAAPALALVTEVGFNKFLIGETAQLKIWLDLLPEDMVSNNPVLLMFKAQLMPNSRQLEIVAPLKKLMKLALLEKNPDAYFNVATVLIYILICRNNMIELREITTIPPLHNTSEELKNKLIILDMARYIGEEQYTKAEEHSENVQYNLLPEDSQWLYLILSCIIYYSLGKLSQGEVCMETALLLANFKFIEPARGFILLFLSIVLSLQNKKEQLPSHTTEIIAIGEKYEYEYLSANGKRLAAYERYLSFDVETSIEMLDYSIFYYQQMDNRVMIATCRLLQQLWRILPNSPVQKLDEAHKYIGIIRRAQPGMMVYEIALSLLGAIAREAGDYQLAKHCLLSSLELSETRKEEQVLCGTCFHIARLYYVSGGTELGHYYLKRAIEIAASNRYFMFWDIHIPTLTEMTLRCIRYGYQASFAQELLGEHYNSNTVNYLIEKIKGIDESRIRTFTDSFITRYKADNYKHLYFVKASLFGTPKISINGITIADTEWKTKKIKGLLEYLLLNCGKSVSKVTLAEILWPESDRKSILVSLRTALYQLRKTLSKYNVDVVGSNAFIYETLDGLQIRKNEALELDRDEFLLLHKELSDLSTQDLNTENKQAATLKRMIALYHGDLMEGSDYGDLVLLERERCKRIFEDSCLKLSSIYTKRGELQLAEEVLHRAFAADLYNENVCLELIKLYILQGRKSKGVKLYYSFKKRIEEELNTEVDKRLTEIIHKQWVWKKY